MLKTAPSEGPGIWTEVRLKRSLSFIASWTMEGCVLIAHLQVFSGDFSVFFSTALPLSPCIPVYPHPCRCLGCLENGGQGSAPGRRGLGDMWDPLSLRSTHNPLMTLFCFKISHEEAMPWLLPWFSAPREASLHPAPLLPAFGGLLQFTQHRPPEPWRAGFWLLCPPKTKTSGAAPGHQLWAHGISGRLSQLSCSGSLSCTLGRSHVLWEGDSPSGLCPAPST